MIYRTKRGWLKATLRYFEERDALVADVYSACKSFTILPPSKLKNIRFSQRGIEYVAPAVRAADLGVSPRFGNLEDAPEEITEMNDSMLQLLKDQELQKEVLVREARGVLHALEDFERTHPLPRYKPWWRF